MIPPGLLQPGDLHLVVNATADDQALEPSVAKLFENTGKLIRPFECLAQGVNGPSYRVVGGDTVPGLYCVEYVLRTQAHEPPSVWASFGEWYLHLGAAPGRPDPQDQYGRAGIGIHGGGSVLGIRYDDRLRPLATRTLSLAPYQALCATHGCVRLHNIDAEWLAQVVRDKLALGARVFVSVHQ